MGWLNPRPTCGMTHEWKHGVGTVSISRLSTAGTVSRSQPHLPSLFSSTALRSQQTTSLQVLHCPVAHDEGCSSERTCRPALGAIQSRPERGYPCSLLTVRSSLSDTIQLSDSSITVAITTIAIAIASARTPRMPCTTSIISGQQASFWSRDTAAESFRSARFCPTAPIRPRRNRQSQCGRRRVRGFALRGFLGKASSQRIGCRARHHSRQELHL